MTNNKIIHIFGAGISGCTLARLYASKGYKVNLYEKKGYVGGNCYDFYDEHGVLVHLYGPHIFHTNNEDVFNFIKDYTTLNSYKNKVLVNVKNKLIPLPINFTSIKVIDPVHADEIINILKEKFPNQKTITIFDLKSIDNEHVKSLTDFIFANVYANYSSKMWGVKFEEINPAIINRVKVCLDYESDYFPEDKYQGLPVDGYTKMIENIIKHENINLILNSQHVLSIKDNQTFIDNELNFTLERGTISSGVNDDTRLTTRVRSTSIVKHTDGIYIIRKDANYLIGAVTYENGVYDGIDRGWIDRDVIDLQGKNEVRISVRRRDDTAIADNELATIAAGIEIKHNFQSANAKDVERAVQDITDIKKSIEQTISLKSEEFEMGTIHENTPVHNTARARMKNMLRVYKGDIIKFQKDPSIFNYGISISDLNGVWRGVDYGWLNKPEFIIEEDSLIKLTARYVDNRDLDENTLKTLTENTFTIVRSMKNYVDNRLNTTTNTIKKNAAIGSISVEYGRVNGASYVFVRIPKTLNDGSRLVPKVALTSRDGSLSGTKRSTLNYAREQDTIFTLNAGLFNVKTVEPVGQLIIDGVSLINTPMTSDNGVPIHPDECYPLAIDGNGNLKTYPKNADTAAMIADGVKYAVTAWGKLVDNFKITTKDIDNEIVHPEKYIRQSIGQYQNGDYCVCSVDMTRGPVTNEAGLSYEELAQLFVDRGVKFAYSLDGGGSAETVIGKRQLNPIYEGSAGRAVPTVITFEIESAERSV